MTPRRTLAVLALGVAATTAGFFAYRWLAAPQAQPQAVELRPDLEFGGLDGQRHRLSEWNGKLLLLNFWATWCAPCLKEIPLLVQTQRQLGTRGLQIVGIAMDDVEPVRQFQKQLGINYPVMVGGADIAEAMDRLGDQLGAFPFSVLIAPDGRVIGRQSGGLSPEELKTWLNGKLPG